jgi:hypothetical protein
VKFKAELRPELCASTDMTHPRLEHVYFDKDGARLVATNGHMIISVPCEPEAGDVTGLVPCRALKAARKRRQKGEGRLRLGKKLTDDGNELHRRRDGQFPPYKQVMPTFKRGDMGTVTFGINPLLLVALARAAGNESSHPLVTLTLKITDEMLDIILVDPRGSKGVEAAVMPARKS